MEFHLFTLTATVTSSLPKTNLQLISTQTEKPNHT